MAAVMMMRFALAVAFVLGASLPAAQQPRDGAARPAVANSGAGRIAGTIVDETSGAPLGGALVVLTSAALTRPLSVVSDLDGHFAFTALPASTFTLTASKIAYVPMAYGAKAFGHQGVAIALTAAQDIHDLDMRLPRGAVLTGTVRDQNGAPISDATVAANRAGTGSIRPLVAVTDDRGVYRIFGLPPAAYLVSAQGPVTGFGDVTLPSTSDVDRMLSELQAGGGAKPAAAAVTPRPETYSFVPIFFPGTTDSGEAQLVTLAAGEERTVDFVATPARTCSIEGTVRTADGSPLPSLGFSLSSPNPLPAVVSLGASPRVSHQEGSDAFLFTSVTPGHYVLRVRSALARVPSPSAENYWADLPIVASGEPITGVSLVLQPGLHFAGKLVFDGATPPPADLTKITITMGAPASVVAPGGYASPAATMVLSGNAAADGTFDMHNLVPGSFVVGATTGSSWRLVSAIIDGRDAMDTPLEFVAAGIAGATLRFVDRHATLSGTLETTAHAPTSGYVVVALPADRALWRPGSRRIQSTRPASDGKYSFHDLPAGDYLIAALTDVSPDDLADVSFLSEVAQSAIKVTLRDDGDAVQNLRISK